MAGAAATKIEFWRSFFRSSEHDLWTIIDQAITVAALDFPDKLRLKRDGFTEKMFAGPVISWGEDPEDGLRRSVCRSHEAETTTSNEDSEYMASGNREEEVRDVDDHRLHEQVLKIKQVLQDDDKTDDDILEALNKLDELHLSIETLKSTSIGKPVNALRKHPSPEIKSMARKIIRFWKAVADEWAKSSDDVPACEDNDEEFGLAAPPMDEEELLAALDMPQTMELMDFVNNNMASGCSEIDNSPLVQVSDHTSTLASNCPAAQKARETKGTGRSGTSYAEVHRKERFQQKPEEGARRTQNLSQKLPVGEYSIKDRLAAAKRKLQEGYQQAETGTVLFGHGRNANMLLLCAAKKQRTVQVMGLEELPKGTGPKAVKRGGHQAASFRPGGCNKGPSGFHRR